MIGFEAAKVAIDQAKFFDDRGLILTPMPNTAIAELFNNIGTRYADVNNPTYEYDPQPSLIEYQSAGNRDFTDPHNPGNISMDALSQDIAKHLSRYLSIVKNTIVPMIKLCAGSMAEHMQRIPIMEDKSVKIILKAIPEVVHELSDDIEKFNDVSYIAINSNIDLGNKNSAEITELMKTQNPRADELMQAWASQLPEALIEEVWQTSFGGTSAKRSVDSLLRDPKNATNAAIILYLLANRLIADIPDGVNMSRGSYNDYCTLVLSQAAMRLCQDVRDEDQAVKSGRIIWSATYNEVSVNKRLYEKWISEGGNQELIYGNSLLSIPFMYKDQIEENAIGLITRWREYNQLSAAGEHQRKAYLARDYVRDAVDDVVVNNFPMAFGHLADDVCVTKDSAAYYAFSQRLKNYCDTCDIELFLHEPWKFAIDLVLTCIYPEMQFAWPILSGVDKAREENPELIASECQLISTLMYVCDYIADQIAV